MRAALTLALAFAALPGCKTVPNVPQAVRVPVEAYRPLPSWATEPLPMPFPADGTVEARVRSEHARGVVIDLANCHRRLLVRIDKGEVVDEKECAQR